VAEAGYFPGGDGCGSVSLMTYVGIAYTTAAIPRYRRAVADAPFVASSPRRGCSSR
jgi:hypothetical protein